MTVLFASRAIFGLLFLMANTHALSVINRAQLLARLQSCVTPEQVLSQIGRKLCAENDPSGEVARLALVRLSKQVLAIDNQHQNMQEEWLPDLWSNWTEDCFSCLISTLLGQGGSSMDDAIAENLVEGIKAASLVSRLIPDVHIENQVGKYLQEQADPMAKVLDDKSHLVSGLEWAVEGIRLKDEKMRLPDSLSKLVVQHNLPFKIYPSLLKGVQDCTVQQLTREVDFQVDHIRTTSDRMVQERRQTAWEGDVGIGPFVYSGKSMKRKDWSSTVKKIRNRLVDTTGQYYDCCLLNLYPDGGSGMRYHIDPDQGSLWDFDTAVVSVGASRRFAFRPIEQQSTPALSPPHNFVVLDGDVTHMFADCQDRFQHTVKKAESRDDSTARVSLVFKRTWPGNADK